MMIHIEWWQLIAGAIAAAYAVSIKLMRPTGAKEFYYWLGTCAKCSNGDFSKEFLLASYLFAPVSLPLYLVGKMGYTIVYYPASFIGKIYNIYSNKVAASISVANLNPGDRIRNTSNGSIWKFEGKEEAIVNEGDLRRSYKETRYTIVSLKTGEKVVKTELSSYRKVL